MRESINFESVQTGQPSYPVECFYRDDYERDVCSALHWHFYSEIIYVNEGGHEITVGNHIVRLYQGDLIYINPQQVHLAYGSYDGKIALTVVKFDPALLLSATNSELEREYLSCFLNQTSIQNLVFSRSQLDETPVSQLLSTALLECKEQKFGYEYALRGVICNIILCLLRLLQQSNQIVMQNDGIDEVEMAYFNQILRYLNDNFQEEIEMDALLAICRLSYSNFAVKFKRLTGKTLTQYLNHIRISYAQQMLITTTLPITEIASRCGFNDGCYFSRVFKALAGKSPNEFRHGAALT